MRILASGGIGLVVLLLGGLTYAASGVQSVFESATPRQRAQVEWRLTVIDQAGTSVPERLVVVFVDGVEVGRSDTSGRVKAEVPIHVQVSEELRVREGEILVLSLAPRERVVVYAFPGRAGELPFDVLTCRLTLSNDGAFRCPDTHEPVPEAGRQLMAIALFMLLLPLGTVAARQVAPWPSMPAEGQLAVNYLSGALLSSIVVVMFVVTGVIDRWIRQLATIFAGAVDGILVAIAVVAGIYIFWVQLRAHFFRP